MKLIPNAVTSRWSRQMLLAGKQSPTLLFVGGVVGVVGTTVLACRATLKMEEVLATTQNDLEIANAIVDENYSDHDRKKDVTIIYVRGAVRVCKLYAPAALLGTVSIGALTASHNILSRRNVALTAAYAAVEKAFNEYRERVVDKYGEEQDREFRYANERVQIVDEKGKKKMVTRSAPGEPSMYARFFDNGSQNWQKEPEYNLVFLRAQQNYWNDLLHARGHVFLNEVYRELGLDHSGAGSVVGWVISDDGDNFIDFGIFDDTGACRDFVNGREGSILLDFNVDGVVYDKIDDHKRKGLSWQKD